MCASTVVIINVPHVLNGPPTIPKANVLAIVRAIARLPRLRRCLPIHLLHQHWSQYPIDPVGLAHYAIVPLASTALPLVVVLVLSLTTITMTLT